LFRRYAGWQRARGALQPLEAAGDALQVPLLLTFPAS